MKVDTRFLDSKVCSVSFVVYLKITHILSKELSCLGELLVQADLLEAAKPKDVPNEFSHHKMTKDGTLALTNARYRNRVRRSNQASCNKIPSPYFIS